jgi:excisionase family DNA binding protein
MDEKQRIISMNKSKGGNPSNSSGENEIELSDLPKKTFLRPDEVALFLRVSLKTVYRWHAKGLLQGIRFQRSLRIFRESVVKLIREKSRV